MVPDVANAPTTVPTTSTATAITMRFFAPIRRAQEPAGKASTMPTNVNTDMSIEVEAMSMPERLHEGGHDRGHLVLSQGDGDAGHHQDYRHGDVVLVARPAFRPARLLFGCIVLQRLSPSLGLPFPRPFSKARWGLPATGSPHRAGTGPLSGAAPQRRRRCPCKGRGAGTRAAPRPCRATELHAQHAADERHPQRHADAEDDGRDDACLEHVAERVVPLAVRHDERGIHRQQEVAGPR